LISGKHKLSKPILGVKFAGRKPELTKHLAREALKRVAAGEPMREIAIKLQCRSLDDLSPQGAARRRSHLIDPGGCFFGRGTFPRAKGAGAQERERAPPELRMTPGTRRHCDFLCL